MDHVQRKAMKLAHALAALAREEVRTDGRDATRYYRELVNRARLEYYQACAAAGRQVCEIGCQQDLPFFREDDNETLT